MMVQDKKTGQYYDADKACQDMFKDPEFIAMVTRMQNEEGKGWPDRKEQKT